MIALPYSLDRIDTLSTNHLVAHCLAKSGKGSPTLEADNRYQINGQSLPNSQALAMQLMQTYLIGVEPDNGVFMAYDVRKPLDVHHFSVQAERAVLCCFKNGFNRSRYFKCETTRPELQRLETQTEGASKMKTEIQPLDLG